MRFATLYTRCTSTLLLALALSSLMGTALAQDESAGAPPLSIQPGTFLTVRINEAISSDRNRVGDVFSATLTQPLISQGVVVAQRGQTVGGRVVDVKRAGMVSGVSRLKITLTRLTLADGQSTPLRTQLLARNGRPTVERDAGAVVATTGAGAVIGAIAGRGKGAAIGAGAGAAAGVLGVLLTRGYPTVVYPETLLTFEVMAPVTVDTSYAPQAFRAVNSGDYQQAQLQTPPPPIQEMAPPPPVVYPNPYSAYGPAYGPFYPYYARRYYYPSYGFVVGYPSYRVYRPYVYVRRPGPVPFRGVPYHGRGRVVVRERRR